jgi:hypothetical protein
MKRSAALRVEALEDRSVPAGTVTIVGWGAGNINIIGDPLANDIDVTGSGPSQLTITGNAGTTLNSAGVPAAWVSSSTSTQVIINLPSPLVLGQLFISLRAGNDRVGVFNTIAGGNIIILPGDGDDKVLMGADTTLMGLFIRETLGDDYVQLDNVKARDPSLISLNLGNDKLLILGAGTVFDDDLTILGGAGSDFINFKPGQSRIMGDLLIDTSAVPGDGGDTLVVDWAVNPTDPPTLFVNGNTTILTGDGADKIIFGAGTGMGRSAILGVPSQGLIPSVNIRMGNQNDQIFASRVGFQLLNANLGNGNDQVLNIWGTAGVSVASGSILDGSLPNPPPPPVPGDQLPSGWSAPPGLTVVGFP